MAPTDAAAPATTMPAIFRMPSVVPREALIMLIRYKRSLLELLKCSAYLGLAKRHSI